jgi:hypothetical protein
MKEQLISYETAVLAKEKGFDPLPQGIYTKYYSKTDEYELLIFKRSVTSVRNDDIKVVTQSLLQKWLREEYDILVSVFPVMKERYYCTISRILSLGLEPITRGPYDPKESNPTYEEALEKGLQEALKLIK